MRTPFFDQAATILTLLSFRPMGYKVDQLDDWLSFGVAAEGDADRGIAWRLL